MSYIIIPSRRTRQPSGHVRANPAWAPTAAWAFSGNADAVSGSLVSRSSYASNVAYGSGVALKVAGTAALNRAILYCGIADKPGANDFTAISRFVYLGNMTAYAALGRWNTAASASTCDWYIGATSNFGTSFVGMQVAVGSSTYLAQVAAGWVVGKEYTLIGRRRGTTILIDRFSHSDATWTSASTTDAGITTINSNAARKLKIGEIDVSAPYNADIAMSFVALFGRSITDSEMHELFINPWQIFASEPRRIFFGAGGGTGPSTYDVTYADSKSLTDSISNLVVFGVTYSDTKTLVDTIASNLTAVGGYSESINLSDSDTGDVGAATYTRDVEETLTLTDSYTTQLTGIAAQTETIDLQETYTGSGIFGVAVTETISLTDNQVQDSAKLGDVTETISLSDAYSSQLVANSGYSDTIDLQDLYSSQAVLNSEITDSQSLTDAYAATVPGGTGDCTLTPETIDLIADEVMSRLYENPVRRL